MYHLRIKSRCETVKVFHQYRLDQFGILGYNDGGNSIIASIRLGSKLLELMHKMVVGCLLQKEKCLALHIC
jgi:hypothetical protein